MSHEHGSRGQARHVWDWQSSARLGGAGMSDRFTRLIVVPEGPYAYDRALKEAIQKYGLNVSIDQVGWSDELVEFEVVDE